MIGKRIILVGVIMLGSSTLLATGATQTACYEVQGMTCAACSVTLKTAVKKLSGIESIQVSVSDNAAQVTFDPSKTNSEEIRKQIGSTGYKVTGKQCKS